MSYYLFLDDERNPENVFWTDLPNADWVIVRDMHEFVSCITERGMPTHISFDNDLGFDDEEGKDCVKWVVEGIMDGKLKGPFAYTVHSKNNVAAEWIEQYLENFFKVFYGEV